MATRPMGIGGLGLGFLTLTLTPIPLGIEIKCKRVGWMNLSKIIFFPVLHGFQIGIIIWQQYFFFLLCCWSFLICVFSFPSASTGGPLEQLAPATQPLGRGGWTRLRRAPQSCLLVLPRSGVFRSGDRWSSRKFCPRKNGTPLSGC